jgi:hypothetical protein
MWAGLDWRERVVASVVDPTMSARFWGAFGRLYPLRFTRTSTQIRRQTNQGSVGTVAGCCVVCVCCCPTWEVDKFTRGELSR